MQELKTKIALGFRTLRCRIGKGGDETVCYVH